MTKRLNYPVYPDGIHGGAVPAFEEGPVQALEQPLLGWREIGTAPKDGGEMLIAVAGLWCTVGRWLGEDAGWWEMNNDPTDSWGRGPLHPTHWMPLPEPPK